MSEFSGLGIGIVGPGAMGDMHASTLTDIGIPVLAVAGPVAAERDEFADKHQVERRYGDIDELLADDDVDAVIVATPSHLHAEQALKVLDAGKHVLAEIPVGLSLADAQAVAERAERVGRTAMVGYTLRYWEPHRRVQETLAERGIVPSQVVVRSVMLRQSNVGWTGRRRDWTDSVLWHHGGHAVDAALWHLGDSGTVDVAGGCGPVWPGSGTQMDVATVLTTADRRLAVVSLSYHSRISFSDFLVISPDHTLFVTEGRLLLDGEVVYDAGGVAQAQAAAVAAQDRDFARAVVQGTRPAVTAVDVLPAMRVLQTLADASR